MVIAFVYIAGFLLLGLFAWMVVASRNAYKEAKHRQTKIDWARTQLDRALEQTRSENQTTVLAGIQCLSTLNIEEVRVEVLRRLDQLTVDADPVVARYAEAAMLRLCKTTIQSPGASLAN
jgi:hypothetical protein